MRVSNRATRVTNRRQDRFLQHRRRHLRQLPVSLQEAIERRGTSLDDAQPAFEILTLVRSQRRSGESRIQAPGNRLDRRQRVVQLMAHHANQSLPGKSLFFPQGPAHIGEHHQRVRHSPLPKGTSPQKPARITVEVQEG